MDFGSGRRSNVVKTGWTVVRGILELAIMLYVLAAIVEPGDAIIVAVLGIIYGRKAELGDIVRLASTRVG